MKNIFITGGLGQDGIILTKLFLKKKGFKLFIFHKKNKKFVIKKSQKEIFIYNENELFKCLKKNTPSVIIHLAANNPAYGEKSFYKFYLKNKIFTKKIMLNAKLFYPKVKFIFANSSQIYQIKKGTVNENSKYSISSHYTRFRIEMIKYLNSLKINSTNLVLFNHDSIYRNKKFLIPRIIKALKNKNKKFIQQIINHNIYGDFSHAEDICNAIYKLSISKTKVKNLILSSNKCTGIGEIIKFLIKKNKLKIKLKPTTTKKINCLKGNNRKAVKLLKWKHKKNIFIAADEIFKLE